MVFIYTEGKDETFIKRFAARLGFDSSMLKLIMTGGKDPIFDEEFTNNLDKQSRRVEDKNIIIFDLDGRDRAEYQQEILDKFEAINTANNFEITIDGFFFLPNNSEPGCLEDLLLSIMHEKPRAEIIDCFDTYQQCVSGKGYKPTEERHIKKTKVFTYLEAMGKPGANSKRKYNDDTVWDFNSPNLVALKTFIESLF